MSEVIQIVPRPPGAFDGVTDYALTLARELAVKHSISSRFLVWEKDSLVNCPGEETDNKLPLDGLEPVSVILHYVGYGYHSRGIPLKLPSAVADYVRTADARLLVMFHELYAFGPPWKSEFWLHPIQVRIARSLITMTDVCFVSNKSIEDAIKSYAPDKPINLVPVMSTLGEPQYDIIEERSARRWTICGGNALIRRSLQSFAERLHLIPAMYRPDSLEVIGGKDSAEVRCAIAHLHSVRPGIACRHHAELPADAASSLLGQCSFAWLDYFGTGKAWPGMIFKSTSFAAACAHAIIPILSHQEVSDATPGRFFMTTHEAFFPQPEELIKVREGIYKWYHDHASVRQVAQRYADVTK